MSAGRRTSDPYEDVSEREVVRMDDHRPTLPNARGPISDALIGYLSNGRGSLPEPTFTGEVVGDHDLQLALYCCYELHYRGFDTPTDLEWDSQVLRLRAALETAFERELRELVQVVPSDGSVADDLRAVIESGADGPSLSGYLAERGTLEEFKEFAVHRSLYQLKEADAHTWAIPRFSGPAKSALVEIQMDEYGLGVPGATHAELFADTMRALDLDATYGAYVDSVNAPTLATNNLVSMFGLHRRLLPALLGHLAVFEMTSVLPMGRYAKTCDRHGLGPSARRFYDVHVEADQHHGPLASDQMAVRYVNDNPANRSTLVWGAQTLMVLERRFSDGLMRRWNAQLGPLPQPHPGPLPSPEPSPFPEPSPIPEPPGDPTVPAPLERSITSPLVGTGWPVSPKQGERRSARQTAS